MSTAASMEEDSQMLAKQRSAVNTTTDQSYVCTSINNQSSSANLRRRELLGQKITLANCDVLPQELKREIAKHIPIKLFIEIRSWLLKYRKNCDPKDLDLLLFGRMFFDQDVTWDMVRSANEHGSNSCRPQIKYKMTTDEELSWREELCKQHLNGHPRAHLFDFSPEELVAYRTSGGQVYDGRLRGTFFTISFDATIMVYDLVHRRAFAIRSKEDICSFCLTEKLVAFSTKQKLYTAQLKDLQSISTQGSRGSGFPGRNVRDISIDEMFSKGLTIEAKSNAVGMSGAEHKLVFMTLDGIAIFDEQSKTKAIDYYDMQTSHLPYAPELIAVHVDTSRLAADMVNQASTDHFWLFFNFDDSAIQAEKLNWQPETKQVSGNHIADWPCRPQVIWITSTGRPDCFQFNGDVTWSPDNYSTPSVFHIMMGTQEWKGKMYATDRTVYLTRYNESNRQLSLPTKSGTPHRLEDKAVKIKRVFVNDTFLIYQTEDDCYCVWTFDDPSIFDEALEEDETE